MVELTVALTSCRVSRADWQYISPVSNKFFPTQILLFYKSRYAYRYNHSTVGYLTR